jgi:group II intron reverse transcriptase/maturase
LNAQAAAGIDQETYQTYGENLSANIEELVERLKSKRYQASDIRRVWIAKPDGGHRPLGILVLEDKIVQKGVAKILSAIYEQDFLDGSYGFRPQRNAHDALKAVELSMIKGKVNYILDVDIRGYFDNIDKEWLMRMLQERIADRSVLRLIGKWLRVGILEEGKRIQNEFGVPQGATISPLLSNIYLHYVLDLWISRKVSRLSLGQIYLIRFADDFLIGCTHQEDAEKVWDLLQIRLQKFGLELATEKSQRIEFGKKAYWKSLREKGKLSTFNFLGFTHYMSQSRKGRVKLCRKTIGKRMRRTLETLNNKLKNLRNLLPFEDLHIHLSRILQGYYNYYGFAGNAATLDKFHYAVRRLWFKWLNRRSQRKSFTWKQFLEPLRQYPLPEPRIYKGYAWIYSTTR